MAPHMLDVYTSGCLKPKRVVCKPLMLLLISEIHDACHQLTYMCISVVTVVVGGVAQWQERQSWLANIPCHMLDLQLMGDHSCG